MKAFERDTGEVLLAADMAQPQPREAGYWSG
jgi:hypothetical protein